MHGIKRRSLLGSLVLMIMSSTAFASELKLESPVEAVPVLELFTSHGCSSCPPADRWLRKFSKSEGLWKEFIPMAFHVDYWDYLGWKDKFAKPRYSNRQRDYRRSGGIRSVYTPGFVVSGKEWRGFFRNRNPYLGPGEKSGRLSATVITGNSVAVRFAPEPRLKETKLMAHVAVLGFGISSDIGAGENSGRNLQEDFVVLGDSSSSSDGQMRWSIPWPKITPTKSAKQAVVIWLSREGNPAPVQAVADWLN